MEEKLGILHEYFSVLRPIASGQKHDGAQLIWDTRLGGNPVLRFPLHPTP